MPQKLIFLFSFFFVFSTAQAQAPKKPNAAEIQLALDKLNVLGSVLYVAAHPDDENTRLISWLANDQKLNTGYLSITRGDGGQNLIGPEIWEQLGIIRTQELLQARRVDGGKQFFTRANDFGFSKHPDETFRIWDREQVLADMVWTIRKFRPDVMITRFSLEPGTTHGHHTASAILAVEAFEAAADPKRFPEQLNYVETWQPTRILWNTSSFFFSADKKFDETGKLKLDVGTYSPLLGKSYGEIAAESRSMHKSQGFGSSGTRGTAFEYLEHLKGPKAEKNLFEGINTSWSRVKGGEAVGKLLKKAADNFDASNPAASVPVLLQAYQAMQKMPNSYWKQVKLQELKDVLKASTGLFLEAVAKEFTVIPGGNVKLNIEAINRSSVQIELNSIKFFVSGNGVNVKPNNSSTSDKSESQPRGMLQALDFSNGTLYTNKPENSEVELTIPETASISEPYWLSKEGTLGMFTVKDQQKIGLPENPADATVTFELTMNNVPLSYTVPVINKKTDPVDGEIYRPFEVIPPVLVRAADKVVVFADDKPKKVAVMVQAGRDNVVGTVKPVLPAGWRSDPESQPVQLNQKGEELTVGFTIHPPKQAAEGKMGVLAEVNGQQYTQSIVNINYPHIPAQVLFPEAEAKIVRLDLQKKGQNIGYVAGAGDEIPASLREIGYNVNILQENEMKPENLARFDAIILGVRALNTDDRLKFFYPRLLEYAQNGGTVIVQYNTNHALVTQEVGPYPIKLSRDRVTVEDAEVRFLKPEHPVLNTPNKITSADFRNWVQERGLYFPSEWSKEYEAILSSNDPGESPKDGGLLVTKHGKGHFIYTGYSWFRQLPAGVPGAYRIFTNLISVGK